MNNLDDSMIIDSINDALFLMLQARGINTSWYQYIDGANYPKFDFACMWECGCGDGRRDDALKAETEHPYRIVITQHTRIGILYIRTLYQHFGDETKSMMIVSRYDATPQALTAIKDGTPHNVNIIRWMNVLLDPQKHDVGSSHRRIKQHELSCIKNKTLLPKLLILDSVAVYMGFRKGEIIAITRRDTDNVYYRIVI